MKADNLQGGRIMHRRLLKLGWILLFLVLLTGSVFCASDRLLEEDEEIIQQSSADYATISIDGGYIVINNVWNKRATNGRYMQRIFTKEIEGEIAFGWDWKWGSSHTVVAYPEVLCGDTPWDTVHQTRNGLPFLAGTREVVVEYNVDLEGTGIFNMAFEFWVTSKARAFSRDITHEVMIWNYNHGITPTGSKVDEVTFDGVTYDVYIRKNHGDASGSSSNQWAYIAFVAKTPVLSGPLKISDFIEYLIEEDILDETLYIATLELGNEVVQGSGRAVIRDYSITVK